MELRSTALVAARRRSLTGTVHSDLAKTVSRSTLYMMIDRVFAMISAIASPFRARNSLIMLSYEAHRATE